MFPSFDVGSVRFSQPEYLWLLVAPAALLIVWFWQLTVPYFRKFP